MDFIHLVIVHKLKHDRVKIYFRKGGPGASSTFLAIYMYKEAFVDSNIGRGTAIAVCMLIMAVLATAVVNKIFAYINRND